MGITGGQLRASVIEGGIAPALGVAAVRFCGSVPLSPRPASATISESGPESGPVLGPVPGPAEDVLAVSASSPAMYLDLLVRDATAAGLPKPTLEEMSRELPYRMDGDVTCSKWASVRSRWRASS